MSTVAVIDYGMGNLHSVCKALEHVNSKLRVQLTSDGKVIEQADRVVFPGQGAITGCFEALDRLGLRQSLLDATQTKPFLGICLGLQALYEESEEGGGTKGLGLISGNVRRFVDSQVNNKGEALKIPHMGWNQVHQEIGHPLWQGIDQDSRFYFVHSYYADTAEAEFVAGTTAYGVEFTSAAAHENIFAVQFHPEKSQHAGLKLLENFTHWTGEKG